jgi:hypothetical protein
MRNKQTLKELGIILAACITIAIIDRLMIVYLGYGVGDMFLKLIRGGKA